MISWAAHRPAVVWALAAGIVVSGGVAFTKLPLATKTTVEFPRLVIAATWSTASPELIETYLTSPIERAVQGVRGVRKTSSTSTQGASQVIVDLDPKADVTMARLAIVERMATLAPDFPTAASAPVVSNYVPEALVGAAVAGDQRGGTVHSGRPAQDRLRRVDAATFQRARRCVGAAPRRRVERHHHFI